MTESCIRIPPENLRQLVAAIFEKAGTSRQALSMKPLPGRERAELAGSVEWQRTRDYTRDGIPVSSAHQQGLEEISAELGVETPFAAHEHTRFETVLE